ncbi:membrane-bound PQQ-dependent dehydrogenase, glucose/quinate/shikimate family [Paraburkholderia sp. MMS20-SJTR3]|uniref:Membrane-bound PQQ-dependent dehydrogenase, glucose/quinate/shikimate family n=1 Tax=Paraburkholderia sejongensis TaxID=2886946 RepID=A0ABS8JRV5_9BURK|nr:membrane-bound PQQ-dependent dehydrogenase, glucose/quinate/shikimate family [Paraburkholderia sp. MMS20-SJTR3]MCC8392636.1 membrane-bound PQQ-dependent dehydrogenase, glucose/quinate/shikimate family [Paraburkholderia sp. MMS20-SJTR3]
MSKQTTVERASNGARIGLLLAGLVLVLLGLFFAIGGGMLIARGGSWYYLPAGLALFVAGIQLARRRSSAYVIYTIFLLATALWSFWEAGFEFWPLTARLFMFTVIGLVMTPLFPLLRGGEGKTPAKAAAWGFGLVLLACNVAFVWGMFIPHGQFGTESVPPVASNNANNAGSSDWTAYGHSAGGDRFAGATQINRDNVKNLQVAWTFRTGDVPLSPDGGGSEDQLTPLQVGRTLFLCTPHNTVIAVDATSGAEKWRHEFPTKTTVWVRCRGLAYFDSAKPLVQPTAAGSTPVAAADAPADPAICRRRIFMNTIDAKLVALDADTGKLCADFGKDGVIDLKDGLGKATSPLYQMTSAPTVAGTTVVVGGRVADNVSLDMPGGVVRGFDVISGRMKWAFDPGNPADRNAPAEGKTFTRSTPNVWAPMSYDPTSNIVFMPVGNAAIDLWGVKRTALDESYGASILALDATTGAEKWHFQTVHHDLWDYDVPMQPTLVDFPVGDKRVPALIVGTKMGQLFVLDRLTGKPLTDVIEHRVKPATIPNEPYAKTQPLSVGMPQIGADVLKESDMWGMTAMDQLMCRVVFRGMRYDGLFTAPDTDRSLSFPGSLGGMNWGGLSYDPNSGMVFSNDMRLGLWVHLVKEAQRGGSSDGNEAVNAGMGAVPLGGTPYSVTKDRFFSPIGIPCQKPPFGSLTAIDLKTRSIAWQVPLGTVRDSRLHGVKMSLPTPVGMPTIGGSLATGGGLVFFAATQDYYLRAFDSSTGKEVWKARLPVGSQGTPISYVIDGKQYIVISAGGARQSPDRGDYVIAFALPDGK